MKSQLTDFATLPPLVSLFPHHSVRDPSGPHSLLHPAVTAVLSLRSDSSAFPLHFVSSSPAIYLFQPRLLQFPKMLNGGFGKKSRKEEAGGGGGGCEGGKVPVSFSGFGIKSYRTSSCSISKLCVQQDGREMLKRKGKKPLNKLNCHKLSS